MNKDQVKGRGEQAKGKLKEVAGALAGNESLKQEGRGDQAAGKVQATFGDLRENTKDAIKKAADKL